jgi:hypothetical protein
MFNQPGTTAGDKIDFDQLIGRLLLIYPKQLKTDIATSFGEKDCLVADVVVLDGPTAGEQLHDAFIFPGYMIGQLKDYVGNPNPALGRIGKGEAKPGKQAPWKLQDFTPADEQIAVAYLTANPRSAFNKPTQTTVAPGHEIDYQAAAAAQALEQQRQAAATAAAYQPPPPPPQQQQPYAGGYVNTGTGEITAPAAAAPAPGAPQINVATIRTLLGLAVPDQDIATSTGATLEQINAIRNLPA